MCLAKAPDVFRCAVSGAPVTSWDGYDTHYTERYMGGTPEQKPDAYAASSVMAHVDGIQGALLLVHGLVSGDIAEMWRRYRGDMAELGTAAHARAGRRERSHPNLSLSLTLTNPYP